MKFENMRIYILIAVILVISSCEQDDATGHSKLLATNPVVTFNVPDAIEIDETDTTFEWSVSLSEAQIVDVAIYLVVGEGTTATEGDDFDLSNDDGRVFINAGDTSGVALVSLYADMETTEETEMLYVQLGDIRTANAEMTPVTVPITINNTPDFAVLDTVELAIEWSGTPPGELELCDVSDLDFYLIPDGSVSLADDVTGFSMATGACPIELADLKLNDGRYNLYGTVYSSATTDFGDENYDLPISISLTRSNNDGSIASSESVGDIVVFSTAVQGTYSYLGDIVVEDGLYSFESTLGTIDPVEINEGAGHLQKLN